MATWLATRLALEMGRRSQDPVRMTPVPVPRQAGEGAPVDQNEQERRLRDARTQQVPAVQEGPLANPIELHWTPREVRSLASSAYRDLADEVRAAGDVIAARELERLAEEPEATLEASRKAWEARFGEAAHDWAEPVGGEEAIRRHVATDGRFVVRERDGGSFVFDREEMQEVVGPVSPEEADQVRDNLVEAARTGLQLADDEHELRLHMQAWHLRPARDVEPMGSADLQIDHWADHEVAGRLSLLPFPDHDLSERGLERPPGWDAGEISLLSDGEQ